MMHMWIRWSAIYTKLHEDMFLKPPAPKRKALSTLKTANQHRGTSLRALPVIDQLGPLSELTNLHTSTTQSLHTSTGSISSTAQPSPLPLREEATILSPISQTVACTLQQQTLQQKIYSLKQQPG